MHKLAWAGRSARVPGDLPVVPGNGFFPGAAICAPTALQSIESLPAPRLRGSAAEIVEQAR